MAPSTASDVDHLHSTEDQDEDGDKTAMEVEVCALLYLCPQTMAVAYNLVYIIYMYIYINCR